MKIAILDDYQDCVKTLDCFSLLKNHEVIVLNHHYDDPTELLSHLKGVQALVLIRERTNVNEALLSKLPDLKLIAQTGKAGRHLDLKACEAHGVQVLETEGTSTATAEFTLLMILASLRHFEAEVNHMRKGQWQRHLGRQLRGRTLGIYGLGKIGVQVAQTAHTLGTNILIWGREASQAKAKEMGWQFASSRSDFFSQSDVLCLVLRLTPETHGIVKAQDLSLMKPDAILVNTARAELIEHGALEAALKKGRPGFAAVDVYEKEPVLDSNHPMLKLPNCLCTPHLGFVEKDNYENYLNQAFHKINDFSTNHT